MGLSFIFLYPITNVWLKVYAIFSFGQGKIHPIIHEFRWKGTLDHWQITNKSISLATAIQKNINKDKANWARLNIQESEILDEN